MGENSAPSWPEALPGEGRALGGGQAAVGQHHEAVDQRGAGAGADEEVAGGVEEHVAQPGASRDRDRRVRDRDQLADRIQPEAGVAAAAIALVRHVDQAERGDRDAHRRDPARGYRLADQHRHAVGGEAQHRDLVAAGVDRQQVPAVCSYLDRALGGQARAQARAAGAERRARERGERAVGVPGEPVDGIGRGGVAVDVGVTDHRGRNGRGGRGRGDSHGGGRRREAEQDQTRPRAGQKAHGAGRPGQLVTGTAGAVRDSHLSPHAGVRTCTPSVPPGARALQCWPIRQEQTIPLRGTDRSIR